MEYLGEPARFPERHPHPWLVLSAELRPKGDLTLRTNLYSIDGKPLEDEALEDVADLAAVEVQKGPGNAFGLGITVGRTRNNDIFINDERISRFHAFFQQKEGVWVLSDAGSKNGTFVDGSRLDPRRAKPLPERAIIDFGGFRARFLSTTPFVELLRRAAISKPPRPSKKK